jgi:hypothetical protein
LLDNGNSLARFDDFFELGDGVGGLESGDLKVSVRKGLYFDQHFVRGCCKPDMSKVEENTHNKKQK